MIKLDKSKW